MSILEAGLQPWNIISKDLWRECVDPEKQPMRARVYGRERIMNGIKWNSTLFYYHHWTSTRNVKFISQLTANEENTEKKMDFI